jgi:hypothetical protein
MHRDLRKFWVGVRDVCWWVSRSVLRHASLARGVSVLDVVARRALYGRADDVRLAASRMHDFVPLGSVVVGEAAQRRAEVSQLGPMKCGGTDRPPIGCRGGQPGGLGLRGRPWQRWQLMRRGSLRHRGVNSLRTRLLLFFGVIGTIKTWSEFMRDIPYALPMVGVGHRSLSPPRTGALTQ